MMIKLKFVERVREQKKWTQSQLADEMGISPRTWRRVRNIEGHKLSPKTEEAIISFQVKYQAVFKRKLRQVIAENIPIDRNFRVYPSKFRAFLPFSINIRDFPALTKENIVTDEIYDYYTTEIARRIIGSKYRIYFRKEYAVEYLNLTIEFSVTARETFRIHMPSTSEWIFDRDFKAAIINAVGNVNNRMVQLLWASPSGENGIATPIKVNVSLVTRPTRQTVTV